MLKYYRSYQFRMYFYNKNQQKIVHLHEEWVYSNGILESYNENKSTK